MVRSRLERGELFLHGWHYLMETGEVLEFDFAAGAFAPVRAAPAASAASAPPAT